MTAEENAQRGLALLKTGILQLLRNHPEGLRNVDVATKLDLHSSHSGRQKDYLSYSILGLMLIEGAVTKKRNLYFAADLNK